VETNQLLNEGIDSHRIERAQYGPAFALSLVAPPPPTCTYLFTLLRLST
jgi:hypothetical protein